MAIIYHYFEKDTFEPEKNYFSTEKVKCERQETAVEKQLSDLSYKWSAIGFHSIGWGCLVGLILMLTFGTLGSLFSSWYCIGAGLGAVLFVGGIIFANAVCWPKENKYAEELRKYRRDYENVLWAEATAEIRAYNEEQHRIADAWRAEHPLEEKIRAVLRDPMSSVDIANLARYYAEEYVKDGVSRETVD